MSQQLINHSPDLKRLQDEGYEIEIKHGYLFVYQIPYVNSARLVGRGTLISELTLAGALNTARPSNHVIYFIGQYPCYKDGSPILGIQHVSNDQRLGGGIVVNHSFSNRPQTGYPDYYTKITRYIDIISTPAISLDPKVKVQTFKVIPDEKEESVFRYIDTNSSRANINLVNEKFKNKRIAIVGLGGSGSYILDLVAKTPVIEIHLIDGDDMLQHNAFRSPGAVSIAQLEKRIKKVTYYQEVYDNLRKGVIAHPIYLEPDSLPLLGDMDYVFISVDKNGVRGMVLDYLVSKAIPFIDVGMGIELVDDFLIGTLRLTVGTALKHDHLTKRISTTDNDGENDYSSNIQIADLNALNACLAVIKWKKMVGFYQDLEKEHHSVYSINVSQLLNDDITT